MSDISDCTELHQVADKRRGAPLKFETPEQLAEQISAYIQWSQDNPLFEAKVVSNKGEPEIVKLPKARLISIGGLCVFLGITQRTWSNWRDNREDLLPVITAFDEMSQQWQLSHASADLINANIISRLLGLADKKEVTGGVVVNVVSEFEGDD